MSQLEGDLSNTTIASEVQKCSSVSEDGSYEPSTLEGERTPSLLAEKIEAIRRACDLRDFDALVSYAISEGGFLRDDVRQLACELILCAAIYVQW